jgi:peptidoglycan LD-endopeptidase LytH
LPNSGVAVPTGVIADGEFYDGRRGSVTVGDLNLLRAKGLVVPVLGRYQQDVSDTFRAGRTGDRQHNASDIMAPRGTLVLAADDAVIRRLSSNALGGITIYATDAEDRFVYYYAHLDGYAPDLAVGQRVQRGEILGYVGTTGNASPDAPHLHFQIMRVLDRNRLWDGIPIDPRPFLQLPGALR